MIISSNAAKTAKLNLTQIASLTAAQLSALTPTEVADLGASGIRALPAAALPGLTREEAAALTPAETGALSAEQFAELSSLALAGLGVGGIQAVAPAALAGMTPGQTASLTAAQVGGLSAAQITALPATDLAALTSSQIMALSANEIVTLGTAGIAALSPAALNAFTPAELADMTAAEAAQVTYAQLTEAQNLTFDDEFNTFVSSPDGSVGWMTSWPDLTRTLPGEAEYYSDPSVGLNPFGVSNGILSITAAVTSPGSNPDDRSYTSGLMTTYKSFAQLYGYFEIRAELPAGQGLWPAFWLLPANNTGSSEIDIFEVLEGSPNTLYASTHSKTNGVVSSNTQAITVPDTTTGFHTYGVNWTPTTLTFYMDGQVIATAPTPALMNQPMYMLVNMAVGTAGTWAGAPASNAEFPAKMQVDYVRAYATQYTQDTSGPAAIATGALTGSVMMGATALAGTGVSLLDASGIVLQTASTNASGVFSFTGLTAGDYQLRYDVAPGVTLSSGPADASTGLTPTLNVIDGQMLTLAAETLTAPTNSASVQSNVKHFFGAGDPVWGGSAVGVTVSLLNAAGTVVATTTTDAGGWFKFSNLGAGTYSLKYVPPAGETIEPGSLANAATGLTAPFTLSAGQQLWGPSGSLVTLGIVSGTVQSDGTAASGVAVALLDANGDVVAATNSSDSGAFSFGTLAPGQYSVQYTAPNGLVLQTGSEASAATGRTAPISVGYSQTATLPVEQLLSNPGSIWSMTRHFGAADDPSWGGNEGGAGVALLNAAGQIIASTVSDSTGWFQFTNLAAGTYELQYTPPAGQWYEAGGQDNTATGITAPFTVSAGAYSLAPQGTFVSDATVTGTVALDSAADPGISVSLLNASGDVVATATTDSSGVFTFGTVPNGNYQVQYQAPNGLVLATGSEANAAGLSSVFTATAGQTNTLPTEQLLSSPGSIWSMTRHFGAADDPSWGGNEGGAGVALLNAAGQTIASTVSDSTGWFQFVNLAPGTYELQYTPPTGQLYEPGGQDNTTTGMTAPFTVSAGVYSLAPQGTFVSAATITGTVDLGSMADAGVSVALLNDNGSVSATTVTDASGAFTFDSVLGGSYQVQYTAPSGQVPIAGSAANASGLSAAFTAAAGQTTTLPLEQMQDATVTTPATMVASATGSTAGVQVAGVLSAGVLSAAVPMAAAALAEPADIIAAQGIADLSKASLQFLSGLQQAATVGASMSGSLWIDANGDVTPSIQAFWHAEPLAAAAVAALVAGGSSLWQGFQPGSVGFYAPHGLPIG